MFSTVRGKDRCQLYYFPRVASQKDKVKKWKSKIGVFEPLVPVVRATASCTAAGAESRWTRGTLGG